MKTILALLAALSLASCAANKEGGDENPVNKNDAVDDFIKVAELQEQDSIRSLDQLAHKIISERYIIVSDKRRPYLVAFRRPCRELTQNKVTPDVRYERNILRAKFDTFSGCRIYQIYALTDGQATELSSLGNRLGER